MRCHCRPWLPGWEAASRTRRPIRTPAPGWPKLFAEAEKIGVLVAHPESARAALERGRKILLAQGIGIARALGVPRLLRWHSFPAILCLPYGLALGPFAYLPYLPLPARIDVEVGEPIHPGDFGHLPEPERAPALYAATEARMQSMLTALYAARRFPVLG